MCYTCVSTYHIFSLVNICAYVHTRFCPRHDCWWCLFIIGRFHKSHLLIHAHAFPQIISSLGSFFKLTVNFLLRRVTRVLWGVSHMTQQCLYLQCSLVNICLCSSFETSGDSCEARFPLEKETTSGRGWHQHMNSQWLVNPRRIVPEKTQWKWTRGMWQDCCDARFLWKRQGMWKRSAASHINLQSHWTQDVFYLKTHGIWKGSGDARFSWKKIRSPGAVGRGSYELTVTKKARHILLEKTQGIWGGWSSAHFSRKNTRVGGVGHPWHINLQSRWSPGAYRTRKHNDFSGPGLAGRARTFHVNLQSRWSPGAYRTRKHNDFSAVGGRDTCSSRKFTVEMKAEAHFTRENTTISPRSVADSGGGVY